MDFLTLQNRLATLHLDTSAEWISGWASNKQAINDAYTLVHKKIITDRSVQQVMKTEKTSVTITDGIWTLPADFFQPVQVFVKEWNEFSEIDKDSMDYRFQSISWTKKIFFNSTINTTIYIDYIQKTTTLVDNTDETITPSEFDNDILNFAMVEYHRNQRDWGEVSNELQYAEWKIQESIDLFWLE